MRNPAVITGNIKEKVNAIKAQQSRSTAKSGYLISCVSGHVLLPGQIISTGPGSDLNLELEGIPDDNRSMVFPDITTEIDGRGYALSIKGLGARTPLYGSSPADICSFGKTCGQSNARELTNELWFGEAPYGA